MGNHLWTRPDLPDDDERLFKDADIISKYTDADAIEDGQIIAVNKHDRMTNGVFAFLSRAATDLDARPPSCWPVPMLDWFRAKDPDTKAVALAHGFIEENRKAADVPPPADLFTAYFLTDANGRLTGYQRAAGGGEGLEDETHKRVWLVPNDETHGLTLMFPSEY